MSARPLISPRRLPVVHASMRLFLQRSEAALITRSGSVGTAQLTDNDVARFPREFLTILKQDAEANAFRELGKPRLIASEAVHIRANLRHQTGGKGGDCRKRSNSLLVRHRDRLCSQRSTSSDTKLQESCYCASKRIVGLNCLTVNNLG